jgi:non-ribosomal peptide synthetase-like protein
MDDWSELLDLSSLLPKSQVKVHEIWQGSPAKKVRQKVMSENVTPLPVSLITKIIYTIAYCLLILFFPLAILVPLLPTIILLNEQNHNSGVRDFSYLLLTPILALTYLLIFLIQTIVASKILMYKVQPGEYPVFSFLYIRKWLLDQFMELSLTVLHPIYATVFIGPIFRAFGAKVGKNTEISTASGIAHQFLEIGEGGFIADAVTLGESDIRGFRFTFQKTIIGNNSFVGNAAVIPQGYNLDPVMLIGVLSTPPSAEDQNEKQVKDWFGSPPIALPRRQESQVFPDLLTVNPSWKRKVARGLVEFIRVLLPTSIITILSILFISFTHDLIIGNPIWKIVILFPIYFLGIVGIPSFICTVLLKWIFVGRYNSKQQPMWTFAVWKSEAITTTYESLAVPFLLDYLTGTFWLPLCLRLLGSKIGKRVCLNTTDITEFDMVTIGDDTILNDDSGPQTHLFEDRVMKIGNVAIGRRCSIGSRTIILYNTVVEDDATILPLSLIMKGETISGNKNWAGSPVKLHNE